MGHRKMAQRTQKALAYLRTSSAAKIGADKDNDRRQRQAIEPFAKRAGYELVAEFYDAAVSGQSISRPSRASRNCGRRLPATAFAQSS